MNIPTIIFVDVLASDASTSSPSSSEAFSIREV